ncbi:MAG: hypothetical protein PHH87_09575 [Desulfuromonas sp.]|nr:hypothetical protein [Desulfuromonas sp.]
MMRCVTRTYTWLFLYCAVLLYFGCAGAVFADATHVQAYSQAQSYTADTAVPTPVASSRASFSPESILSADISSWGRLFGYTAKDIHRQLDEDDDLSRLQARLGIDMDKRLPNHKLSVRVSLEADRLFYAADEADKDTDIILHETYMLLSGPRWDFSLGKQRVRWGKSDQLSPLDSINPEDMRQFITIDLEERMDPSWLARVRTHGQRFSVEAIVSPWFKEAQIDYFDSNWALYRNLRQSILNHPGLPQAAKDYTSALRVHEKKPSNSLENMSGALRLLWQGEQTDFALSHHYGWETLPYISSFPVKNIAFDGDPSTDPGALLGAAILTDTAIEARFKRQKITGFEWETVIDPIGFRGELAYIDKVSFLSADLTSIRRTAGHLVTGVDYISASEWYFNLQASWYHIFDYDGKILYFERDNVSLLGVISKPVWRGNLEFATRFNYTLTDASYYVQPNMTLNYFTNIECEIGLNIFGGAGDTIFGSHDHADQAYAQIIVHW